MDNDPKAVGPFILAGIEVEKLKKPAPVSGWSALPEILARIQMPTFPDRTFPITDFGAEPGDHLNTDAIRAAIEACHQAGGGHVVVPTGDWLTGPVHLLSNVDLHLSDQRQHCASKPFGSRLLLEPCQGERPVALAAYPGGEQIGEGPDRHWMADVRGGFE